MQRNILEPSDIIIIDKKQLKSYLKYLILCSTDVMTELWIIRVMAQFNRNDKRM